MSASIQLPALMTVAEFLDWRPPDGDRWELVDGVPRAMAPASPRHGAIQAEAGRLIGNHLADTRLACRVLMEAGIQPRARAASNVRVPDLMVTCAPLEPGDRLVREPVAVIEILSPSNHADTWANVWSYTTISSVREILVLHSTEPRAELLRREADGVWPENSSLLGPGDTVTLESIGFSAPLSAFYRTA